MQGIKRKASAASRQQALKLKKQATSADVKDAVCTLKKSKTVKMSPSMVVANEKETKMKKADKQEKASKKPSPLPRIPTLKPTKLLSKGPDFTNLGKKKSLRGVKRQATSSPRVPVKLKKQSTNTTVDKALITLKKARSVKLNAERQKHLKDGTRPKAVVKKAKKPLKMPRFPTLVPSAKGEAEFSLGSAFEKIALKKQETILLEKAREEQMLKEFPEMEDPLNTRASKIRSNLLKLPSGSQICRIMHIDHMDGMTLPTDASLAIYECQVPEVEDAPAILPISRPSLFEVITELGTMEKEPTPEMPNLGEGNEEAPVLEPISAEQEEECLPPVLEAEVPVVEEKKVDETPLHETEIFKEAFGFGEVDSQNKTSVKSPRKMTGSPREIVISFDTTGSMYDYLEEARERIKEFVQRLQEEMPGVRIAFIAHGDYYDLKHDRYLIKWIDFGASLEEISNFFDCLRITHGGDADECYELVLRKVCDSLSWTTDSQKSLIIIGDSPPHEVGYMYEDFINDINWRTEVATMKEMGVRIYSLQVGYVSSFYKELAQLTGGAHLRIGNPQFTYDVLMSICLREGGLRHLKGYEHEVRAAAKKESSNGGSLDLELERLFSSLKNIEDNKSLKQRAREQKMKENAKQREQAAVSKRPPTPPTLPSPPPKKTKVELFTISKASSSSSSPSSSRDSSPDPTAGIQNDITSILTSLTSLSPETDEKVESNKQNTPKKTPKAKKGSSTPNAKSSKSSNGVATKMVSVGVSAGTQTTSDDESERSSVSSRRGRGRPPKLKKAIVPPQMTVEEIRREKKMLKENLIKKQADQSAEKKSLSPSKACASNKSISNDTKNANSAAIIKNAKTKNQSGIVKNSVDKTNSSKEKNTAKSNSVRKNQKENASDLNPQTKEISSTKASKKPQSKETKTLPSPGGKKNKANSSQKPIVGSSKQEKTPSKASTKSLQQLTTPSPRGQRSRTSKKNDSKESPRGSSNQRTSAGNLPLRENMSNANFSTGPLSNMKWTMWTELISNRVPKDKAKNWTKSQKWCSGFCNDNVDKNSGGSAALYEIAVGTPSGKKFPVLYYTTASSDKKSVWNCFSKVDIQKEVARVLSEDGSIFVRLGQFIGGSVENLKKADEYISVNYDYAWCGESRLHDVVKDGFVIAKF